MLAFSPLNEEAYDVAATRITYLKLFQHILEDFITREDAKQILKSSNLPVSTTVQTTVNTVLAGTAGPAPISGTGAGAGNGSGSGTTSPIYVGDIPGPGSQALKAKLQAEREGSGAAITASLGALGEV